MAVKAKSPAAKEFAFRWEGKDRTNKIVKGEMRASGENVVKSTLRRQGINVTSVKKVRLGAGRKITELDIAMFTRQLATMLKSGVPLLTAFDIVAKGHSNPSVTKLLMEIKTDIETGSSLTQAFRKHPNQFDNLYCNLVQAGEQAGILDALLARLATYKEKILAVKKKIKSAMFYPTAVIVAAFVITAVIMIFVIPAFKELFSSFGADLPGPTLLVMAISDFFVDYWYIIFGGIFGGIYLFLQAWKKSEKIQFFMDRLLLKLPIFGEIVRNATIARWTRTLATMFAAGVPLVESLESVGGASGNIVYKLATQKIQSEVSTGTSLTSAMQNANVFPNMVLQMTSIGEESGSLDAMLSKVADYFEEEVDNAVEALSSLMEPIIMVVLGTLIGGLVVAMYLPIFKMGAAVG
ncbi:type II secretion system F family protein [Chitinibacter sp. SCUT-21]|uniref:type II secretion system F family protein n=1 Tax=Chitinibacter sp. SCUT-21 TaxID=2970891 RepID=UPI0035A7471E